ncbi:MULTISPECIES: TadE/TadG family type IV pilus assembly protein [unclassified Xanthobacter]|uniref:TadE/TadG family type IV pilus assembly protein n=1 Tax=unclassified Xanthobacter TaxID=2623496 RepID=UPI001F30D09E|nr:MULTISPECIES: TadE/TadG family type IV pilus assembly protein [unclassified Xanthobacter]
MIAPRRPGLDRGRDLLFNSRAALHNNSGAMAVEYAAVLYPVVLFLVATLELSTVLLTQGTLHNVTQNAARMISDGGIIGKSNSAATTIIRDYICDSGALTYFSAATCKSSLRVGLMAVTSSTTIPAPIAGGAVNSAAFTVTSTDVASVLLLRTGLQMPDLTIAGLSSFPKLTNGRLFLVSGGISRVNPYAQHYNSGDGSVLSF